VGKRSADSAADIEKLVRTLSWPERPADVSESKEVRQTNGVSDHATGKTPGRVAS
jgi:hypothetical protein